MLNEKPNLDSGVLHPIRKDIRSVCHLKMNYVQNTAGGRCVKDMKDKDTPESIFFLSFLFLCRLTIHAIIMASRRASRSAAEASILLSVSKIKSLLSIVYPK